MSARPLAVGLAALLAAGGAAVFAAGTTIDRAAEVETVAARLDPGVGDLAVAYDVGDVDRFVVDASAEAARRAGGYSAARRAARSVSGASPATAPRCTHPRPAT